MMLQRGHVALKLPVQSTDTHTHASARAVICERISRNNGRLTGAWPRRAPGAEALALPLPPPLTFTPALLALARSHPAERAILPKSHAHQKMDQKRVNRRTQRRRNKLQAPKFSSARALINLLTGHNGPPNSAFLSFLSSVPLFSNVSL